MKLTIKTLATALTLACASTSAMADGPSRSGGSRNGGVTPRGNFNSGTGQSSPVGQSNRQQPVLSHGPITSPIQPTRTFTQNTSTPNSRLHHMGPGSGLAAPANGTTLTRSVTQPQVPHSATLPQRNANPPLNGQLSTFRPMTPPGRPPQITAGTLTNLNLQAGNRSSAWQNNLPVLDLPSGMKDAIGGNGRIGRAVSPSSTWQNSLPVLDLSPGVIDAIGTKDGNIGRGGEATPPTAPPPSTTTPPSNPPPSTSPTTPNPQRPIVINFPPINFGAGFNPGFGSGSGSGGNVGFSPAPAEIIPVTVWEATMPSNNVVTGEAPVAQEIQTEEIDLEIVLVQLIETGDESSGPLYRVVVGNRSDIDLDKPARILLLAAKDTSAEKDSPFIINEVKLIRAGRVAVLDIRLPANVNTLVIDDNGKSSPFKTLFAMIELPDGYHDSIGSNNVMSLERTAIKSVAADSRTTNAR